MVGPRHFALRQFETFGRFNRTSRRFGPRDALSSDEWSRSLSFTLFNISVAFSVVSFILKSTFEWLNCDKINVIFRPGSFSMPLI